MKRTKFTAKELTDEDVAKLKTEIEQWRLQFQRVKREMEHIPPHMMHAKAR